MAAGNKLTCDSSKTTVKICALQGLKIETWGHAELGTRHLIKKQTLKHKITVLAANMRLCLQRILFAWYGHTDGQLGHGD